MTSIIEEHNGNGRLATVWETGRQLKYEVIRRRWAGECWEIVNIRSFHGLEAARGAARDWVSPVPCTPTDPAKSRRIENYLAEKYGW